MAEAVEDEEEVVAEAEVAMGEEVGRIYVIKKGSASRGRTARASLWAPKLSMPIEQTRRKPQLL